MIGSYAAPIAAHIYDVSIIDQRKNKRFAINLGIIVADNVEYHLQSFRVTRTLNCCSKITIAVHPNPSLIPNICIYTAYAHVLIGLCASIDTEVEGFNPISKRNEKTRILL